MVLLVVGIIFIIASLLLLRGHILKLRQFREVEGRIVGYIARQSRNRRSGRQTFYHPVAEYTVGSLCRAKSSIGSTSFAYEIGDTVRVMYNPDNPSDADIKSLSNWIFILAFGIFGIGAIVLWVINTDFNDIGATFSPIERVFWLCSIFSLVLFGARLKHQLANKPEAAQPKRQSDIDDKALWNDNLFVDTGKVNRWRGIENTFAKIGGLIGIGLCIWLMHREGGLIPLIELYKIAWETQSLDVKPGILMAGFFSCVLMLGGLINVFRR